MRWIFFAVLVIHGLIHLMGFAKAFRLAELPQLTQPISPGVGVLWLVASLAVLATAILFIKGARLWWAVGLGAAVLSQFVILSSWADARVGTIGNIILITGVVYGFASVGPFSFRAKYRHEVGRRLATRLPVQREADRRTSDPPSAKGQPLSPAPDSPPAACAPLREEDLQHLPDPVRRYLRLSGAVGQPRARHIRACWRGRIRAGPDDPWMPFTAEQHNFLDEPSRFFLMKARRAGLPVAVFHTFQGGRATMSVRLLSLVPLVNAGGSELTRAETVTLLNDRCLLAPSSLADSNLHWEEVDARSARVRYKLGPNTVSATLIFNDAGELIDFVSEDRLAASADGTRFTPQRWSTPVGRYRSFGGRSVSTRGQGVWHPPEGAFAYIELELLDLATNSDEVGRQSIPNG